MYIQTYLNILRKPENKILNYIKNKFDFQLQQFLVKIVHNDTIFSV